MSALGALKSAFCQLPINSASLLTAEAIDSLATVYGAVGPRLWVYPQCLHAILEEPFQDYVDGIGGKPAGNSAGSRVEIRDDS